jgi:hypothetical protein
MKVTTVRELKNAAAPREPDRPVSKASNPVPVLMKLPAYPAPAPNDIRAIKKPTANTKLTTTSYRGSE